MGCNIKLQEEDFVMKVESFLFHPSCFRCIVCHIVLSSGDSFRLNANGILCKRHYDKIPVNYDRCVQDSGKECHFYKIVQINHY